MTKQSNGIYPGMIDNKIEFFDVEGQMKFMTESKIECTSKLPFAIMQMANEEINKDPKVKEALYKWHPESEFKRLNQFLKCRYGGLDYTADFENNEFKQGDYFHCPKRASCPFNGIICKSPVYNNKELSSIDIQLMIQLSGTNTNEVIALELNKPLGSLHKLKQALYEKLGVQTKQEIARIAVSLNLI